MAKELQVSCDLNGCRRVPGEDHDHVELSFNHRIASSAVSGSPTVGYASLDFCSWEHATKWLQDQTPLVAEERERVMEEEAEADERRKQVVADAKAAQAAAEEAAAAEAESAG